MLTKLHVSNFQRIQSADLDLDHITLIVGHNMVGKSALLRALHALCFNRTGDGFIREGEDCTTVGMTVSEQPADGINWIKHRKESASYWRPKSDQSWLKTGSSVPDPIAEALKIRRIEVDSTFSIAPQFKMQHDTLLIKESGSRLARILGSLTKLDVVVKAQMECRKDKDREKKAKEAAETEAARLAEQVAELEWVQHERASIDQINETLSLAAQAAEKYEQAGRLIAERKRLQAIVARLPDVQEAAGMMQRALFMMGNLEQAQEPLRQRPRLAVAVGQTQAVQDARESLSGVHLKLVEVSERKERLILCGNAITAYRLATTDLADKMAAHTTQQIEAAQAEEEYRIACDEADLCDHCPLREGV